MRQNICLTLPNALRDKLDQYARQRGLPRSYAAQELLERVLPAERPQGKPKPAPRTETH